MSDVDQPYNPYASPEASVIGPHGERDVRVDFSPIIRRWERLRLIYNGVLTVIVLLPTVTLFPQVMASGEFWVTVLFCAAVANLCYFTGPAIEGYGTHFGFWNPALTGILFFLGLVLASFLAAATVLSFANM